MWRPIYRHSGERLSSSYVYLPILHFEHNFLLNINTNLRFYTRCLLVCLKLLRKKAKLKTPPHVAPHKNINNSHSFLFVICICREQYLPAYTDFLFAVLPLDFNAIIIKIIVVCYCCFKDNHIIPFICFKVIKRVIIK